MKQPQSKLCQTRKPRAHNPLSAHSTAWTHSLNHLKTPPTVQKQVQNGVYAAQTLKAEKPGPENTKQPSDMLLLLLP